MPSKLSERRKNYHLSVSKPTRCPGIHHHQREQQRRSHPRRCSLPHFHPVLHHEAGRKRNRSLPLRQIMRVSGGSLLAPSGKGTSRSPPSASLSHNISTFFERKVWCLSIKSYTCPHKYRRLWHSKRKSRNTRISRKISNPYHNKMDEKSTSNIMSTFSLPIPQCAIEGNSFSVDDTRELKEKGLGMIPAESALRGLEMLDGYESLRVHDAKHAASALERESSERNQQKGYLPHAFRSVLQKPFRANTPPRNYGCRRHGYLATTKNSSPEFPSCWNLPQKAIVSAAVHPDDSCRPLPWLLRISPSVP